MLAICMRLRHVVRDSEDTSPVAVGRVIRKGWMNGGRESPLPIMAGYEIKIRRMRAAVVSALPLIVQS